MDINGQKLTETDRNLQNKHKQTEMDRSRQQFIETDRKDQN